MILIQSFDDWAYDQREWIRSTIPNTLLTEMAALFVSEDDYLLFKMKFAGRIRWETTEEYEERYQHNAVMMQKHKDEVAALRASGGYTFQLPSANSGWSVVTEDEQGKV